MSSLQQRKYFYTITLYIFIGALIFLVIKIDSSTPEKTTQTSSSKSKTSSLDKDLIGSAKTIRLSQLHNISPHIAFPLRKNVNIWIVNVPLTPFRAPLLTIPQTSVLTNFLLYKPKVLSPVTNQGACGCCWAFALCDMLSSRLTISTRGIFNKTLSVQELLSCFARDGCDGGSPENAGMWLASTGKMLNTDKKIPYIQQNGGYVSSECPSDNTEGIKVGVVKDSVRSIVKFIKEEPMTERSDGDKKILHENILAMKHELTNAGPIYCALSVYDDLFSYTGTSIYEKGKNNSLVGGHAINIIGYCNKGVDKRVGFKEHGYWICKNSWGQDWPLQSTTPGYFAVRMGVNECGIESRIGICTPIINGKYSKSHKQLDLKDMRWDSYNDYVSK
jgi:C1A family cysteine protease